MTTILPAFDSPHAAALYNRLGNREARIGVVGLGYVGLPLAMEFARAGFTVVGIDVDPRKCHGINAGESHVDYVPATEIAALGRAGKLVAVSDIASAEPLDTVSICVPTPLSKTRDPDLSYVIAAAEAVKAHLRPGMLIVLESTTYPGTTEELVKRVLEGTGLKAGADFFLAYSPERVDPALPGSALRPRVVGGLTPDCSALAAALYGAVVKQIVHVSSPRAAEMTKLLENTFRAVNIGLVNEMAILCDRIGINIWEVIEAAATKPAGFMPFFPGPGLGGHCIPIDPFYLSWKVREVGFEARFIELAGQVNGAMPSHVVEKIADALNEFGKAIKGSQVLILGVAYKRDVSDIRESPALQVMAMLLKKGALVSYHDPFVPQINADQWLGGRPICSLPYSDSALRAADCVVILTDHTDFDYAAVLSNAQVVVDTQNAIKTPARTVFKLGAPNPTGNVGRQSG